MAEPISKPRLPVFGNQDGDQILTSSGNVYEFNAEKNEWICIGIIQDPNVVTLEEDGLVSPDVFRKLALIQELIEQGVDFSRFKIDTDLEQDPYFYYFHSSDDLIKFSPEKCAQPKEVIASPVVGRVVVTDESGDGGGTASLPPNSTVLVFTTTFGSIDFTGLTLETIGGNFEIASSVGNSVTINRTDLNILSGDKVKIVRPESLVTKLRIEVDKGRLYQKLVRNCCVGPKGVQGDKGDTGSVGESAEDEKFQLPSDVTSGSFSWDTIVQTPVNAPISLRIFRQDDDDNNIIEIIHPLDGSATMVVVNDEDLIVEETPFDSNYSPTSKRFTGSIVVTSGADDITAWRYKVRQRGAKGDPGNDGKSNLEVETQLLDDPLVRSTDAVLSARKAAVSDDLVLLRGDLFEQVPVSNLAAASGDRVSNILDDKFAAVRVIIEEAKDIGFFQFKPLDVVAPPLDIPLWTPTADCVQAKRWSQYRFDWFNRVDPDYLFSVIATPKPLEQCCQEDFFFCPNIGDNPCGIEGTVSTPVPFPVLCECECENPIASELSAGGLTFSPMDLTDPTNAVTPQLETEASVIDQVASSGAEIDVIGSGGSENLLDTEDVKVSDLNTVESIIDGTENTFNQNIKLVGNGEIIVTLEYDSDVCGGPQEERELCAFVDSNAVRAAFFLEDTSGTAIVSSSGLLETLSIPVTAAFTITGNRRQHAVAPPETEPGQTAIPINEDGQPREDGQFVKTDLDVASLKLKIVVNSTKVDYCRGYRITIIARSDEIDVINSPNFIIVPSIPLVSDAGEPNPTSGLDADDSAVVEPDPEPEQPIIEPPFPSFAADGIIVVGGGITDPTSPEVQAIEMGQYAHQYSISQLVLSGTGADRILIDPVDVEIGQLVKAPTQSQVPLVFDQLQDNTLLSVPTIALSRADAGFGLGPFGVGTYVLGDDFRTTWSSRIPSSVVRTDDWSDVFVYFNEPKKASEPFRFVLVGSLSNHQNVDHSDSTFVDNLFHGFTNRGVIVVRGEMANDPMKVINDGSLTFINNAVVAVAYSDGGLDLPRIVISPIGTDGT